FPLVKIYLNTKVDAPLNRIAANTIVRFGVDDLYLIPGSQVHPVDEKSQLFDTDAVTNSRRKRISDFRITQPDITRIPLVDCTEPVVIRVDIIRCCRIHGVVHIIGGPTVIIKFPEDVIRPLPFQEWHDAGAIEVEARAARAVEKDA